MYKLSICVALILIAASASHAQQLIPFCTALNDKHVACDQPSLLHSLKSEDPQVRIWSVFALAERKNADADAAIHEAWSQEADPPTRFKMSSALLSRGDEAISTWLLNTCTRPGAPAQQKIEAMQTLEMTHQAAPCASSIIELIKLDTELSLRIQLLQLLQYARIVPASAAGTRTCTLAAQSITDSNQAVRIEATDLILKTCLSAAAWDQLTEAAKNEKETSVSVQMTKALSKRPQFLQP